MGMLSARCGRDDTGSGTAIGVAIMFVPLMGIIILLSMLTGSARAEQALQSTANRVARTASLCCHYTGDAATVVQTALRAAQGAAAGNRVVCTNVLVDHSTIRFTNVAGNPVPIGPEEAVPPGGSVSVELTCRMPPEALGGVGFPGLQVARRAVGVASIDPFRSRSIDPLRLRPGG